MLFLLALPIFLAVAAARRYLALYAPSNVLIRRMRSSPSRWRAVFALAVLTTVLILVMRTVGIAIGEGAPSWLNMVALLLAWDAIKFGAATAVTTMRCLARNCSSFRRQSKPSTLWVR
jgi:hypothetical protein